MNISSLRKRDSNPPDYIDLERNTIPQLQKILIEFKITPPATSDRDELIRLIRLKTTPRKAKNRKMFQRAGSDDESSDDDDNDDNDFNVSKDQFDDTPIQNEGIENSQNSGDLSGIDKDDTIPSAESMMADDELSNSAFDAESSIATPQRDSQTRPASKLFPAQSQSTQNNDDKNKILLQSNQNQYSYSNSDEELNSESGWESSTGWSTSTGWSSSSDRQSPQRRARLSPPKKATPSNKVSGSSNRNSNKKRVHRQASHDGSNLISLKWLLMIFLLFLLLFFLLLALIPLPGEIRHLTHCPTHAICNSWNEGNTTIYTIKHCEDNYKKIENGIIQVCSPSDASKLNEYKNTLEAASYISHTNGDCFFNTEDVKIEQIIKRYPQANIDLLTTDDFYTIRRSDNILESCIPQYEPTCRAFHACDNSPALTGLVIVFAFIASYFIVRHYSDYLRSIA